MDKEKFTYDRNGFLPSVPLKAQAFYKRLSLLLGDSCIQSAVYRGTGDIEIFNIMASEQRRRSLLRGKPPSEAFYICALSDITISDKVWEADFEWYLEGIGRGDVFIDDDDMGGISTPELLRRGIMGPHNFYMNTTRSYGEIIGYEMTSGDGFFVYRKYDNA